MLAAYVVFAAGASAWRWMVLTNVVADALNEDRKNTPEERVTRIGEAVLRGAREADLPLTPEEVSVSADGSVVTVRVRHVYRAFEYGQQRVDIPISVDRSLNFQ